ncbi:helix-turn-helix domain-containing protein [Cellulosimicrobium cellulans]|uniref:helix-turn-helix domain-containing protein n=1 Tax=Cellulosimicrobium cellulans TaxID=1710 RepID=UPI001BA81BBE|nr:helix-turn-helix domain-containing protein [Cellulosimicrobium cellulans]QUC00926.1 helix-turn-helix domain-containing protein [Cellulosimicrobium cellulans]
MTQQDQTGAGGSPRQVRYRGRHLPMVAVVIAATIATALAYSGMVLFGLEVAHMSPLEAYGLAGFLEISLVAVALMARNAALEGRPYGVLLALTWVLSGTSGLFAALHEIAVPTASTPYMVVFRFVPPLVAALMWHLALVGERHMVTGHTLEERRRELRVHGYVSALEQWRDARADSAGSPADLRKVRAAHERQRAARDAALKLLTVEDFERRMQVWVDRLEAAERHGNRLDLIGASSAKRGTARGRGGVAASGAPAPAEAPAVVAVAAAVSAATSGPAPLAPQPASGDESDAVEALPAVQPADAVTPDAVTPAADVPAADVPAADVPDDVASDAAPSTDLPVREVTRELPAAEAAAEVSDEDSAQDARAAEPAFEALPDLEARVKEIFGRTRPLPWEQPVPEEAETTSAPEPPAVTGHTRRVEVFDLPRPQDVEATTADDVEATLGEDPTAERDRRIVELAREGLNQREIAQRVSASRSTVSRVVRRYEDQLADEARELANA